jgi:uncharacterized protein YuzE
VEKNMMEDLKVYYDEERDILYLAREGQEAEVVEFAPGVNVELDESGKLIGIELFRASFVLKDVMGLIEKKVQTA